MRRATAAGSDLRSSSRFAAPIWHITKARVDVSRSALTVAGSGEGAWAEAAGWLAALIVSIAKVTSEPNDHRVILFVQSGVRACSIRDLLTIVEPFSSPERRREVSLIRAELAPQCKRNRPAGTVWTPRPDSPAATQCRAASKRHQSPAGGQCHTSGRCQARPKFTPVRGAIDEPVR